MILLVGVYAAFAAGGAGGESQRARPTEWLRATAAGDRVHQGGYFGPLVTRPDAA